MEKDVGGYLAILNDDNLLQEAKSKLMTDQRKTQKKNSTPTPTIVCKIYATWCGHCKDLQPVWAELKNLMEPNKNIQMIEIEKSNMKTEIGKLQNVCKKNIDVKGFPTIVKICKSNHGDHIVEYYEGERTVNALRAWIMQTKGGKRSKQSKRSKRSKRTTRK